MRKIKIIAILFLVLVVLPTESMASPLTAEGENATRVEEILRYLYYATTGEGDKVLYVYCGPLCSRCSSFYKALERETAFNKEFQIRWVISSDQGVEYLFPLENKPGAGIKELYGASEIEPQPAENLSRLEKMDTYNRILLALAREYFDGTLSSDSMTPFIYIKTQNGFEYGSFEDFWNYSALVSFDKALPLAEGIDGMKYIVNEERLSDYLLVATDKDIEVRLFPSDDAPLIPSVISKGYVAPALSQIGQEWVGVKASNDPSVPLAYAKKKGGELQRD